jgi:membrane associated rhomboid family serine protease
MNWLRRLERRLAPLAIPNLTQFLIAGQVVLFFATWLKPELAELLVLRPKAVVEGEWWRLLTFVFVPSFSLIFWLLEMYFLHLIGTALEGTWGALRYNVFVLISYLATIAVAVCLGGMMPMVFVMPNSWIYGSLFLAFAYLFPEFEILVLFVLPVKMKWLGLLGVIGNVLMFLGGLTTFPQGGWLVCAMILAGNLNLLIFFGRDIVQHMRSGNRRMARRFEQASQANTARHVCIVCGATERTHPDREFRYCPKCAGTPAYCSEHLAGHEHRSEAGTTP